MASQISYSLFVFIQLDCWTDGGTDGRMDKQTDRQNELHHVIPRPLKHKRILKTNHFFPFQTMSIS